MLKNTIPLPHMGSTPSQTTQRLRLSYLQTNIAQITSGSAPGHLRKPPKTDATRNGRWRSLYIYSPLTSSLTGSIKVDVHYYEDGNVRLLTSKPVSASITSASATSIVREITVAEKKYQEEVNRGFTNLSEGAFKGLRRQLPITRQKIEWDKIAGYKLGQDIGGGSSKR
jgi:hypothetical protein